jgi:hypothetical protein
LKERTLTIGRLLDWKNVVGLKIDDGPLSRTNPSIDNRHSNNIPTI